MPLPGRPDRSSAYNRALLLLDAIYGFIEPLGKIRESKFDLVESYREFIQTYSFVKTAKNAF